MLSGKSGNVLCPYNLSTFFKNASRNIVIGHV